jgi:hypothetical protein
MTRKYCSDCAVKFTKEAFPWGEDKILCPTCFKKEVAKFDKLPNEEKKVAVEKAKLRIRELRKECDELLDKIVYFALLSFIFLGLFLAAFSHSWAGSFFGAVIASGSAFFLGHLLGLDSALKIVRKMGVK